MTIREEINQYKLGIIARYEDNVITEPDMKLICKMLDRCDDKHEANSILGLVNHYYNTGFDFGYNTADRDNSVIRYLKRNDELSIPPDRENAQTHQLYIGDNLDALEQLLISNTKVDVIYIDPPYAKDAVGKHAKEDYKNNYTRDEMLSDVFNRVQYAYHLLKDDGIFFCSIDSRNHAYLKGMLDKIFGELNCVGDIVWYYKNATMKNPKDRIGKTHEYILMYRKTEDFRPYKLRYGEVSEDLIARFGQYANEKGEILFEAVASEKSYLERMVPKFIKKHGRPPKEGDVMQVLEPNFVRSVLTIPTIRSHDFTKNYGVIFSNPKNTELIKVLLQLVAEYDGELRTDLTVLDFYAGSGTTMEAVMELNRLDQGTRRCILCTLNDDHGTDNCWPNGLVYDCTHPRLKTVLTGESSGTWPTKYKPYKDGLEVYDIETILPSRLVGENRIIDAIDETLYGLPKFTNIQDKIQWICENFDNARRQEGDA